MDISEQDIKAFGMMAFTAFFPRLWKERGYKSVNSFLKGVSNLSLISRYELLNSFKHTSQSQRKMFACVSTDLLVRLKVKKRWERGKISRVFV